MKGEILGILLNGDKLPEIKWRARSAPKMPSPILVDDETISSQRRRHSLLSKREKPGNYIGKNVFMLSSAPLPLMPMEKIYFCDRNGVTHVVKPGKKP